MSYVTRFAPSPTGPLHLGHAFSALTAWDRAEAAGGTCRLRIEGIDTARCRPEWEAAILDDLAWLGLAWPEPALDERHVDRSPQWRGLFGAGIVTDCGGDANHLLQRPSARDKLLGARTRNNGGYSG